MSRRAIVIISVLIIFITLISALVYPYLPETVATHWGISGQPNGFSSALFGAFFMPIFITGLVLLFCFIPKIDPLNKNWKDFQSSYELFVITFIIMMSYIHVMTLVYNLGHNINMNIVLFPAMAFLFIVIGYLMPTFKMNWFMGIRTPWTLTNEIVWEKTHKLGGQLFMLAGVVSLLGLVFPEFGMYMFLVIIFFASVVPTIYSYVLFKNIKKHNHNKKMNNHNEYGKLTGQGAGIIMKEMVRRSMLLIRQKRMVFESREKDNPYKDAQDFVTDVDIAAQKVYISMIKENFPDVDIVAEEDIPELPKSIGSDLYFTIDPLDGTKAFIRGQSDGVGSLLTLVKGQEIIAAFVGDINTQELYYYRPNSEKVHRINYVDEVRSCLNDVTQKLLTDSPLLLTENPDKFDGKINKAIFSSLENSGLFKNIQISSGSIGTNAAKLWKGEVGALLLKPSVQQPWDIYPVIGISQKLGYVFGSIENRKFKIEEMSIDRNPIKTNYPLLIIHRNSLSELNEWFARLEDKL